MKVLGLCMVAYGILKGQVYRKSESLVGKRMGLGIAFFYVSVGLIVFTKSWF